MQQAYASALFFINGQALFDLHLATMLCTDEWHRIAALF